MPLAKPTASHSPSEPGETPSEKPCIHIMSSFMDGSQYTLPGIMETRYSDSKPESFLDSRSKFKVIVDDLDLTPQNITHPEFPFMDESYSHAAYESSAHIMEEQQLQLSLTRAKSKAILTEKSNQKVYATFINLDDLYIDHTLDTRKGIAVNSGIEQASSAFLNRKMSVSYPPEITISLKETETLLLFEFPSHCCDKETPEGAAAENDNTTYEYITVGKGRNRKMINEETQTINNISQSRHTLAERPELETVGIYATTWDMYDTYKELEKEVKVVEEDEMVLYQRPAPELLRRKKIPEPVAQKAGKTFEEIASTPEFLDAVLVTERVLTSVKYTHAQKKLRGLVKIDPLSLDLVYIYSMKPLWTFECEDTMHRPAMNISFNPKNPSVLAACHGKFSYVQDCQGMICIWCTKNPSKPERVYHFEVPLTSVCFSEKNPNWLACGFWNGDVIILDITSYSVKIVAASKRATNPSFDPVWGVCWRTIDRETEYVMTICEDGRINKFMNTKTHEFICAPMMRVSAVEGKLRGLQTPKPYIKTDVPINRYPGVLCMRWHPTISHIYLVGTSEGCIHKCSTHYLNQHIDVFRAHAGPIYDMMMCPFHDQLLVTCGADNAIRLWMEGMDDVILTLMCPAAVHGVAFCPMNATILISVSGNVMAVWDLRRKTHKPCAEYTFDGDVILTYVHFDRCGDNVFVGDTLGRVHTFHLEDTPISPYYQRIMLDEVIHKALCTRPHLLKQLNKLERARAREKLVKTAL